MEIALQVLFGDVWRVDGDVDEVLFGVAAGGALGPGYCLGKEDLASDDGASD